MKLQAKSSRELLKVLQKSSKCVAVKNTISILDHVLLTENAEGEFLSYSVQYVKDIAKAFPKLVEQVKEQNKERDPSIMTQDVQDENSHLFKALRNRLNKRLAMFSQPLSTPQQTTYQQPVFAQAGTATAYVPPANTEQTSQPQWGENFNESDLPSNHKNKTAQ